MPHLHQKLTTLCEKVAEKCGQRDLGEFLLTGLYDQLFHIGRLERPITTLNAAYFRLSDVLSGSPYPAGIDRMYVQCSLGAEFIRLSGIPVVHDSSRWHLLSNIAFELSGLIAPCSLKRRICLKVLRCLAGSRVRAARGMLGGIAAAYEAPRRAPCLQGGETTLAAATAAGQSKETWERVFEKENPWNYGNCYDQVKYRQTLELLPQKRFASVLELACAEGHFTLPLGERADALLATDISENAAARCKKRCAHLPHIEVKVHDFMNEPLTGTYDLVVCSEVLYYVRDYAELRRVAQRIAQNVKPGGHLVTAHAHMAQDASMQTGFEWGHEFGADAIVHEFSSGTGLRVVASVKTELYRIDLLEMAGEQSTVPKVEFKSYGKPLPVEVAAAVIWDGAVMTRMGACAREVVRNVPVAMYHQIATEGPVALEPYRISPIQLEQQLRYLRRRGYYSLNPELLNPDDPGQTLPGRPIMLTFDDATTDFMDAAFPILQRHGFSAHVFVPTGFVGASAQWEVDGEGQAPLMTWDQLRALAGKGITFGSHLVTHRAATALSSQQLLEEAVQSRRDLESQLSTVVTTVAPPYGCCGFRETRVLQMAGYRTVFKAGVDAVARAGQGVLPRVRVCPEMDIKSFGLSLGLLNACPDQFDWDTTRFPRAD